MRFVVNNSGFELLYAKDVRAEFGQGVPHQLVTWVGLRQINMVEGIDKCFCQKCFKPKEPKLTPPKTNMALELLFVCPERNAVF